MILKLMPNLMFLNSLPVERDEDLQNENAISTDTRPSEVDEDENYQFTPNSILS